MEKSTWVKIVWLGAVLAIPLAVMAVRKPEVARSATPMRRPMALDQPMSIDISDHQIDGPKPAEVASVDAPKPHAVRLGTEKITSKAAAADPPPTKVEVPGTREPTLAAALAPVPGPQAAPSQP
jgi:hypothetical protein